MGEVYCGDCLNTMMWSFQYKKFVCYTCSR